MAHALLYIGCMKNGIKYRIIIVDDDRRSQENLKDILEQENCHVDDVQTESGAFQKILKNN